MGLISKFLKVVLIYGLIGMALSYLFPIFLPGFLSGIDHVYIIAGFVVLGLFLHFVLFGRKRTP